MDMKMRPVVSRAISRIGTMSEARIYGYAQRSLDAIRNRSWLGQNSVTDDDFRAEYIPTREALDCIERAIDAAKGGKS